MSKVINNGSSLIKDGVDIDVQLVIDPVWKRYPKLFHIWVYIQSKDSVSYSLIARDFDISVNAVAKHIKTLKELCFKSGDPVLEIKNGEYTVTVSAAIILTKENNYG